MLITEAQRLTLDLMAEHGLVQAGWRFRFDHARRRFGSCRFHDRTITLSRHLVAANETTAVRDTILHEIAHALVARPGHGADWKRMAIRVGAKPERCYSREIVEPQPAWALSCPRCGTRWTRHRVRRIRYACSRCRDVLGRPVLLHIERLAKAA